MHADQNVEIEGPIATGLSAQLRARGSKLKSFKTRSQRASRGERIHADENVETKGPIAAGVLAQLWARGSKLKSLAPRSRRMIAATRSITSGHAITLRSHHAEEFCRSKLGCFGGQ